MTTATEILAKNGRTAISKKIIEKRVDKHFWIIYTIRQMEVRNAKV